MQPVVAVRFCSQLFKLRDPEGPDAAAGKQQGHCPISQEGDQDASHQQEGTTQQQPFQLPYRMVFAIATLDSVIIYDTQVCTSLLQLVCIHATV